MLTMAGPGSLEHLFEEFGWGTVTLRYEHCPTVPAAGELAAVHVVPFVATGEVVIARVANPADADAWIVPGGTLEPGETWLDAAARELLEETGARMLDVTPFGAVRLHDDGAGPFRPHLPWPDCTWVVAWAEVELVGSPTAAEAEGAEPIAEVRVTSVEEAAGLLEGSGARAWADVYRLAGWLRRNTCAKPCS